MTGKYCDISQQMTPEYYRIDPQRIVKFRITCVQRIKIASDVGVSWNLDKESKYLVIHFCLRFKDKV